MFAEGPCRSGPPRNPGARAGGRGHAGCEDQEGHLVPGEGTELPEHPGPVGSGGSGLLLSLWLRMGSRP